MLFVHSRVPVLNYSRASPPTWYTVFSAASVLIVSVERRKGAIRHCARLISP